jgi:hypothetical protein
MGNVQYHQTNESRLAAVDTHIKQYSITIGKSLKALLYDERANTDKMLAALCSGIIGLTFASSKRRDLVTKGAKDDLSKFVVKEMERVRKQHGLKKTDVYRDEFIETD